MANTRKLWLILTLVMLSSFGVPRTHRPGDLPDGAADSGAQSSASDGTVLFTGADVDTGRQAWQSAGGQQLGSIWGHGGYVAPDWSADWLHREAVALLDGWSQAAASARSYADLAPGEAGGARGAR